MSVNEWEGGSFMLCKFNQIQRIGVSHDSCIYIYLCSMTLKTTAAAEHNLKTFNTSVEISNESDDSNGVFSPNNNNTTFTFIHLLDGPYGSQSISLLFELRVQTIHTIVCVCVCSKIKSIKLTKELAN